MYKLTIKNFEELFGDTLSKKCKELISKYNLKYKEIKNKDDIILQILKSLDEGFSKTGDIEKWEKGWKENLDRFSQTKDTEDLTPKYYKINPLRLNGNFVFPKQDKFEIKFFNILLRYIAENYLYQYDKIYEFGTGSAHNLIKLCAIHPDKQYVGLDWAKSSQGIIEKLGMENIKGVNFDMLSPPNYNIDPNSVVLTVGALEQLGNNFKYILNYWIKQPVSLFVHIEPFIEMYEDNLLDYLAKKFTLQRNYLNGYLTYLESLDNIKIIRKHRIRFGSLYHEGWNLCMWRKKYRIR